MPKDNFLPFLNSVALTFITQYVLFYLQKRMLMFSMKLDLLDALYAFRAEFHMSYECFLLLYHFEELLL